MKMTFLMQTAAAVLAATSLCAQEIEATDLYDLPPADVVFLGEIHDNPIHHAHQAIAVVGLGAQALVFEMLTEDQALRITPELMRSEPALEATLGWHASGWPDFAMYFPVFNVAADKPIFGAALDRDEVRRAVSDGAASVFGDGSPIFGLSDPLDDAEQVLREAEQLEAHCGALTVEMLSGMVEAQRLRDAAIARAVLAAFAETGGPVAVITGNGHARRDWGAVRALLKAAPNLRVLTIGQFEQRPEGAVPFDLWLVTDPAKRPDPCDTFEQR